jgi:hypothetical protein
MSTQDSQKRRGEIHEQLMQVSKALNAINPGREPMRAREILATRRELQAEYVTLMANAK